MKTNPKQDRPRPRPRREVGRVIRRLLSAVDRVIAAAEDARQARDDLLKLSRSSEDIDQSAKEEVEQA